MTSNGVLTIDEVASKFKRGELIEVFSHNGLFRRVLRAFEHPFHGELIVLKPAYLNSEISITPSHRVLIRKGDQIVRVRADELQKGDLLVIPIPQELKREVIFDLKGIVLPALTPHSKASRVITPTIIEKAKELRAKNFSWRQVCKALGVSDHLRRVIKRGSLFHQNVTELIHEEDGFIRIRCGRLRIPRFLRLDGELARLIGYYLAEGYVTRNHQRKNSYSLAFVFNENEKEFIEDVASILRGKFKINPIIWKDEKYHICYVSTYSSILALFFKQSFGASVYDKKIPMEFLFLSNDLQKEIIKGIFRGDGLSKECIIKSYPSWKMRERIQITSDTLRVQIFLILCKLGFIPSQIGRDVYLSDIAQTENMLKLMYDESIQLPSKRRVRKKLYGAIDDGYLYLQIRKIKRRDYDGIVYDFEVEGDHTFTIPLVAVSNCQNWHLSKFEPNPERASYYSPEQVVKMALLAKDEGVCASFQEPTLLTDWTLDLFKLARDEGLYCCYVSNGYMTIEALMALKEAGLDGLKIDVKGDAEVYKRYCGGVDVEVVWRNAREAKRLGLHVEIVNLIVTDVNDDEECLRWIIERHLKEVGPETPLHFTRYYPAYKFHNPPTKVETLKKAYEVAKKEGIMYPYVGNVPGHPYENTYCPRCGDELITRRGYIVVRYRLTEDKRCRRCGQEIMITGRYVKKPSSFLTFL